jgi:hypothetical protein
MYWEVNRVSNDIHPEDIKAYNEKVLDHAIQLSNSLINSVSSLCTNCRLVIRENIKAGRANSQLEIDGCGTELQPGTKRSLISDA